MHSCAWPLTAKPSVAAVLQGDSPAVEAPCSSVMAGQPAIQAAACRLLPSHRQVLPFDASSSRLELQHWCAESPWR